MDENKVREYEIVLSEIINNMYNPITPKRMKEVFGMDNLTPKTTEYDRVKTNLQRILDFYNSAKIITIVTDTIQNEIKKLTNRKDMEKLKPYIELLKQKSVESKKKRDKEISSTKEVVKLEIQNICDKYTKVEKVKSINSIYDKNGKEKIEEKTTYQLFGEKLIDYIDIDFFSETVEYETKHFTNEKKTLTKKTICLEDEVDLEDKEISPYDIMYRLFLECDFKNEYGKLESPIEFEIPQKNTKLFVEFFLSMVTTYDYDVKSKSVVELSKSDLFQNKPVEVQQFITDTFSKVMIQLSEYYKGDKPYPIQLLIDLIESESKLNIKFTIDNEEVEFSKTSIKKLIVKEDELNIKLSHSTINLSNINQITSIKTYDIPLNQSDEDKLEINKQFWIDVDKLKNILSDISDDNSREMIKTIEVLEELSNIIGL